MERTGRKPWFPNHSIFGIASFRVLHDWTTSWLHVLQNTNVITEAPEAESKSRETFVLCGVVDADLEYMFVKWGSLHQAWWLYGTLKCRNPLKLPQHYATYHCTLCEAKCGYRWVPVNPNFRIIRKNSGGFVSFFLLNSNSVDPNSCFFPKFPRICLFLAHKCG